MQMFVDAFQAAIMACKGEYVRGSPMAQRLDRLCFESGAMLRNLPAKNYQTLEELCAQASNRGHAALCAAGALRCIAAISHPSKKFNYHLAVSAATSSAQARCRPPGPHCMLLR
jgi:hypothetical protein